MVSRVFPLLLASTWLTLPAAPAAWADHHEAEAAAEAEADPFEGTFRVTGTTKDRNSGDTRRIEGMVVLSRKGERYSASADLETKYPSEGGAIDAHVIGTGHGERKGSTLEGTADTQLVLGTVPGMEADFAFIPRIVGPRIVSTWKATLTEDGAILVEIQNEPGEGEEYAPTMTKLRGKRMPKIEAQ